MKNNFVVVTSPEIALIPLRPGSCAPDIFISLFVHPIALTSQAASKLRLDGSSNVVYYFSRLFVLVVIQCRIRDTFLRHSTFI